jgi:phosphate starvation-inducible membrane PsiE
MWLGLVIVLAISALVWLVIIDPTSPTPTLIVH